MVTRCYLCGGTTEHRLVTAENWWGDELALVEQVPAWVCQNCGEAYFEADTCRQLDRLRQSPPSPLEDRSGASLRIHDANLTAGSHRRKAIALGFRDAAPGVSAG